ncbi:MAG: 2-phosphosulfolactate phosphatase [Planctomycetia bacterium]
MNWICHPLFNRMPPGATAGGIAVVIDVLRASTTIVTALAHGASRVRPVLEVADARQWPDRPDAPPGILLGGERGGLTIPGFDLGNSPLEYSAARVAGRPVVITTTNGTAAIDACNDALEVLVGAVVNRSAVAAESRRLADRRGTGIIHLVCAGTDGAATEEDLLAAGAILDAATRLPGAKHDTLDPSAREVLAEFLEVIGSGGDAPAAPEAIAASFAQSRGGRNLIALGMRPDLAAAARIDSLPLAPRLDRGSGWIEVAADAPA